MTTLEIAEFTDKQHKNVMRDIRELLEQGVNQLNFEPVEYTDKKKGTNIVCTPDGNQEMWFLTEDGLYEILMLSRKPIAKQFKKGIETISNHLNRM